MSPLDELVAIVARLRGPQGCPWDRAADLSTMRPYLLEEVYEVLGAMDRIQDAESAATGAPPVTQAAEQLAEQLAEELGDLLFVVLLLVRIGQDRSWLSLKQVAAGICAKMVTRHPHVFGAERSAASASLAAWEARKARKLDADGRPKSRLAGVPSTLPALLAAHRQGEKAAAAGFDWPDHHGVLDKIHEEVVELEEALALHPPAPPDTVTTTGQPAAHPDVEHELGDLLMAVASLGRQVGAPPEAALRRANARFADRFTHVEGQARAAGLTLDQLDDTALDAMWERAKQQLSTQQLSTQQLSTDPPSPASPGKN